LILTLLSLGLEANLHLSVWDVKGAFLKTPTIPGADIYVRLHRGLTAQVILLRPEWKKSVRRDGSMMVRCKKAWYGLAASSALWNRELTGTLVKDCGFTQHKMVPCLFYRLVEGVRHMILLHVDDMGVLMPENSPEYIRVKGILEAKYDNMRVQEGDKVTYIGYEIQRNRTENTFTLSMKDRIETFFSSMGTAVKAKPARNPAMNSGFMKADPVDTAPHSDIKGYRSLVMTLAYISAVLPEIKFHVSWLATKQSCPSKIDWCRAIHLLHYVYARREVGIVVRAIGKNLIL
jgi:hypothetical protein